MRPTRSRTCRTSRHACSACARQRDRKSSSWRSATPSTAAPRRRRSSAILSGPNASNAPRRSPPSIEPSCWCEAPRSGCNGWHRSSAKPCGNAQVKTRRAAPEFYFVVAVRTPGRIASIMRVVHLRLNVADEIVRELAGRKTALVSDAGDGCGDVSGNFSNPRQSRIEAALLDVGFADELRQYAGGRHEHLVGHQPGSARDRAKTDAGEDVGVIPLARHEGPAVELHRIEWAAACEQRAAAGLAIGLLGGTFGL